MKKRAFKKITNRIEKGRELHLLQLAAISTASIQNTEKTIKNRIPANHCYSTATYRDVCRAIDREMKLIEDNRRLQEMLSIYYPKMSLQDQYEYASLIRL